jgi:hypothetical protein
MDQRTKADRLTRLNLVLADAEPLFPGSSAWDDNVHNWLTLSGVNYGSDPFGRTVCSFAWSDTLEWLEVHPWARLTYARILLNLRTQQRLSGGKRGANRTAARVARRYLLGLRQNPEWIDSDLYEEAMERSGTLPRLRIPNDGEIILDPASEGVVDEATAGLRRLRAGVPISERSGSSAPFDSTAARAESQGLPHHCRIQTG